MDTKELLQNIAKLIKDAGGEFVVEPTVEKLIKVSFTIKDKDVLVTNFPYPEKKVVHHSAEAKTFTQESSREPTEVHNEATLNYEKTLKKSKFNIFYVTSKMGAWHVTCRNHPENICMFIVRDSEKAAAVELAIKLKKKYGGVLKVQGADKRFITVKAKKPADLISQ